MEIQIEDGIPIPEDTTKWSHLLKRVKAGNSIVIPSDAMASFRTMASRSGWSIVSRRVDDFFKRVWFIKKEIR